MKNTDSQKIDKHHRLIYNQEAYYYDKRRFSRRRGKIYHYYEVKAIIRLLAPLEGLQILDMPTGTARIALELSKLGAHITAVDLSMAMLSAASQKIHRIENGHEINLVNGNGRQLPFANESFDVVMSIRFLHLLPPDEWGWFFREMRRVVKPDGYVLVQLFNPFYGGPLALLVEGLRKLRGQPGECFVWPHRLNGIFKAAGLTIQSVTSFWLPGMGVMGKPGSLISDKLSQLCEHTPVNWVSGPHLILSKVTDYNTSELRSAKHQSGTAANGK